MNTKILLISTTWAFSLGGAYWVGTSIAERSASGPVEVTSKQQSTLEKRSVTGEAVVEKEAVEAVEADPLAVLEALTETSDFSSWEQIEEAMANLRPYEAKEALTFVSSFPPGAKRDEMVVSLLEKWAELDPLGAMDYLTNIESMRLRDDAAEAILEQWGRSNPVEAISWIDANADSMTGRVYSNRMLSVIAGYAEVDPQGAFNYSSSLPEDTSTQRNVKSRALGEVVRSLVESDQIGEAVSLISGMEPGNMQTEAFSEFIEEWARYDPTAAVEYLGMLGEDAAADAKQSLMRSWAEYDPVAAAEWLSTLPADDPEMGSLVNNLIGRWTRYDLEASAAWLNQIPPSPEIDRAVAIYTYRSAQEDPAGAMSWAESVTRDNIRDRLMTRVASEWKQQDPDGFQSYIETAEISDEQKTQLQEAQPGRGFGGRGNWRRD
ncbi:hypothetical protein [Rubellicoccus peritrichatus]|uniref:Uncharacterized protein n=1 Tax=Rubellicoccus peritrichatus TaxID=3080537 RepID=A0AAQ3QVB3_9BACT|nr:hypothetical protein [Puniceicoccus sp. CR14]WOO41403.1 hypothetical protein RZN69_22515 [Puniceicoccus sp. CR14]